MDDRTTQRDSEVLIKCEHVSKKFCRGLKRSLWYGIKDLAAEIVGMNGNSALRTDEFPAVKEVSFELRRGECLGLIGHNGAGKSTLLKMLNGLIKPASGRIEIRGRVGALIELGAGFNSILTGRENIYNRGAFIGFSKREIDEKFDAIVDFAEIHDFIDMPVQNYSSGMKVRLGFAVSAQMEPDILLIDEVLAVGDLGFVIKCFNRIGEILPKCCVIFVSHSMPMVARVATDICVMDHGQLEYFGKDVPHGLELYIHKFDNRSREEQGSAAITLQFIGLRSFPSHEYISDDSFVLQNGDPLHIRLTFCIPTGVYLDTVDFFVKILDQQLREVVDCLSSYNNEPFVISGTQATVNVTIPAVYLNRGKHSITVGVEDRHTKTIYSRITNTIEFFVRSPEQGWATSVIPGEWWLDSNMQL